jgi:hypothetical protein
MAKKIDVVKGVLFEAGKGGFKTGAASVLSDEIVALFNKHLGKYIPSWLVELPMFKSVEAALVPGLVFALATFSGEEGDDGLIDKAKRVSLLAFEGKVHDLTRDLWKDLRPLLEDIAKLKA